MMTTNHTAEIPETITTATRRVHCDGGGGALGHPRVWLTIDVDTDRVTCPYCSRVFVYDDSGAGGG